jgi:hypothetical protein
MRLKVLRVPRLACVLIAGAIAATSAQQPAVDAVERVQAALQKPPSRLTLEDRKPDFTIRIEERRPLQHVFDLPPWVTPTPGWTPPTAGGGGIDPVAMVRSLTRSKRGHDARVEVQRAIADYCAAQPSVASIQICSTLPAIR